MPSIGVIGLGKNCERSIGHKLAKELFRKNGQDGIPNRILVNSRTPSTIDLFFQQGVREVLEQNLGKKEWEGRFSYSKNRPVQPVEDIVKDTVQRATYEQIAEQTELTVVCLEAQLPTAQIASELARRSELRREVYQANAVQMRKLTPCFKDYPGMVLMVTNPPSWHCMDWYEQTRMEAHRIAGVHPETCRLRDFTGLFSYLSSQGIEVKDLQGMDRVYVLGDHGGSNMVVPLSMVVVGGLIPPTFRPSSIKKNIATYLNQMANRTLRLGGTTSHEITALISRMVQSYYVEDAEEYVLAVYASHLCHGRAVFSGEPVVFKDGRAQTKPLDFLTELEKTEYLLCLERMRKAWETRHSALPGRRGATIESYLGKERLFKVPLFLP